MVRMSDILKRARERKEREQREKEKKPFLEPGQPETASSLPPPSPLPQSPEQKIPPAPQPAEPEEVKAPAGEEPGPVEKKEEQKEERTKTSEVRISPLIIKKSRLVSDEETEKIYDQALFLMQEILRKNIDYKSIDVKRITAQVEKIVDQLNLGNEELLKLAFIKDFRNENYLSYHSINVCIWSIEVGMGLAYDKSRLIELGICALLHDAGMPEYLDLTNQPRKLTAGEYDEVKNHPVKGSEILEKIKNLGKIALYVAHQEHERVDGSGYPQGLKEESITEYARIIGLVDTYEAMTHPRSYRGEFLPLETMQEILTKKDTFGYKLIKVLIEKVGIFPVGSYVELSTKETAQVIKLNHTASLRPVVKIIYEADSQAPKETRIVDLTDSSTVYIKKGLRKSELSR